MDPKLLKRFKRVELVLLENDSIYMAGGFGPVWDWNGAFLSFGWQFGKWIISIDIEVMGI